MKVMLFAEDVTPVGTLRLTMAGVLPVLLQPLGSPGGVPFVTLTTKPTSAEPPAVMVTTFGEEEMSLVTVSSVKLHCAVCPDP